MHTLSHTEQHCTVRSMCERHASSRFFPVSSLLVSRLSYFLSFIGQLWSSPPESTREIDIKGVVQPKWTILSRSLTLMSTLILLEIFRRISRLLTKWMNKIWESNSQKDKRGHISDSYNMLTKSLFPNFCGSYSFCSPLINSMRILILFYLTDPKRLNSSAH